jgi:hypothetical protein
MFMIIGVYLQREKFPCYLSMIPAVSISLKSFFAYLGTNLSTSWGSKTYDLPDQINFPPFIS